MNHHQYLTYALFHMVKVDRNDGFLGLIMHQKCWKQTYNVHTLRYSFK